MDNDLSFFNNNIHNGDLVAITMGTEYNMPVENCGNLRSDPSHQLGTAYYHLNVRDEYKDLVLLYINSEHVEPGTTIVIDAAILNDNEIMDALRRKIDFDRNYPGGSLHNRLCIRILDEGYTLTREDYDKLQFFDEIIVDNCDENILNNHNNITAQNGLFKLDYEELAQPVIERRTNFGERITRNVYHINHRLTDEEFEELITYINNDEISSIELNLYDQSYYPEFLTKLREHHVKDNINILLIGYPLGDSTDIYQRLNSFPYEIDIIYSLCHDMVNFYEQEPYTENRMLYSHLEGSGKTSLENYVNILRTLDDFQREVQNMELSPLETAIYAKMRIDEEYIYDPDSDNEDVDQWDNINLSQIINHNDGSRNRAICVGFSTLYSAMLRKCNVPMFRSSTNGHTKNIGRIKDDKYNVDTIGTFDPTFDLESTVGDTCFRNFGLAPRRNLNRSGEALNLEATLSIPYEEYERNIIPSQDLYELFYHPLITNPRGYLERMLELVGYIPENGLSDIDSPEEHIRLLYESIYDLCEQGRLEGIDREAIIAAARTVLRKRNTSLEDINHYVDRINETIDEREDYLMYLPQLQNNYDLLPIYVDTITPETANYHRTRLQDIVPIQNSTANTNNNDNINENNNTINNNHQPDEPVYNQEERVVMPEPTQEEENNHEEPIQEDNPQIQEEPASNTTNIIIDDPVTLELGESSEELIPGTNIHRPRGRGNYESDEDYVAFLEKYYNKYFPNADYIRNVLNYCQENNINLYNYYREIGNLYHTNNRNSIPAFERENPFLSDNDIELLVSYQDDMALVYFANSMLKTIGLNMSDFQRNELEDIFTNPEDNYNEEISRSR